MNSSSRRRSRFRGAVLASAILALGVVGTPWRWSSAQPAETPKIVEEYAVIVSPDVPVAGLTLAQVRRMFLFTERYWKSGTPVRVLLSDDGLVSGSFLLETIYQMDPQRLRRYIIEKLYQQEIDLAPKVVGNDDLAVKFVASGSRLIAIVRAEAVKGEQARVLPVDGALPGSPGYALRK